MPKKIDHPKSSLSEAINLSNAVMAEGDNCERPVVAKAMGRSVRSSGFQALCGSAVRFGLVQNKAKGVLAVTNLGKDAYLAHRVGNSEEMNRLACRAFIVQPLFGELVNTYAGKDVPKGLDGILEVRHGLSKDDARRAADYFVKDGQKFGIIDKNNRIIAISSDEKPDEIGDDSPPNKAPTNPPSESEKNVHHVPASNWRESPIRPDENPRIRVSWGNDAFEWEIDKDGDFTVDRAIFDSVLKKVEKYLQEKHRGTDKEKEDDEGE